jgi:hypothetical protein
MRLLLLPVVLLPMVAWSAETLPECFPTRRGPLLMCHAADLADGAIPTPDHDWLCSFQRIVTNGYDLPDSRLASALRSSRTELYRYFWANGFTTTEIASQSMPDGDWRRRLLQEHPQWLLNAEPLPGPPGTPPSYYFDLARPELLTYLCGALSEVRRDGDYAGIFFDYAGEYPLPSEVRSRWIEAHPDLPYDRALAALLDALRVADPGCRIFTNQACLGDPRLLGATDDDMVESYGASFLWGTVASLDGTDFPLSFRRPWEGPGGLAAMFGDLMARLRKAKPRRELLCLDYMRPAPVRGDAGWMEETDLEAVYYSYCAAALWGLGSYCSGWYGRDYRGPLYHAELGRPLGDAPLERDGVVTREYERGLIAVLARPEPARVTVRLREGSAASLYNLLDGSTVGVRGGEATLRLRPTRAPTTDILCPTARLYLKIG